MQCCALLLALTPRAQATVEAVDSEGRLVTMDQPATRVIALAPHIVENLFSLGAQDAIVGTVHYSDYPTEAQQIPRVGGVGSMSLEQIVVLEPDLIVLWGSGTSLSLRSNIERLGLSYFVDEIRSLGELEHSLEALGTLTGRAKKGQELARELRQSVTSLSKQSPTPIRSNKHAVPGVFLQVWDQPLQSIGRSHLLNEVIERCGGQSITRSAVGLAPVVSLERVLQEDPALIIVESQEQARHWEKYPQLRATREARVAVIDSDLLYRPSLRLLEGMEKVCSLISNVDDIGVSATQNN